MVSALLTLAFLAGILLLAYGAWLVYHPAGYLTVGVFLVAVPVVWARGAMAEQRR